MRPYSSSGKFLESTYKLYDQFKSTGLSYRDYNNNKSKENLMSNLYYSYADNFGRKSLGYQHSSSNFMKKDYQNEFDKIKNLRCVKNNHYQRNNRCCSCKCQRSKSVQNKQNTVNNHHFVFVQQPIPQNTQVTNVVHQRLPFNVIQPQPIRRIYQSKIPKVSSSRIKFNYVNSNFNDRRVLPVQKIMQKVNFISPNEGIQIDRQDQQKRQIRQFKVINKNNSKMTKSSRLKIFDSQKSKNQ